LASMVLVCEMIYYRFLDFIVMIWEISCLQLFQNKKLQKEGNTCSEVPIKM